MRTRIFSILLCCLLLTSCAKKGDNGTDSNTDGYQSNDKYTFNFNSNCRITSNSSLSRSSDFVYITPLTGGFYEYDTVTGEIIELPLPVSIEAGGAICDAQLYNGKLFTTSWDYNEKSLTNFSLLELNTNEYETVLSSESGQGAQLGQISEDGYLFYTANLYGDNDAEEPVDHLDENRYDVSYSLIRYDTHTGESTTLVDGVNNYYLSGDRIYFDRIQDENNTVKLFYTDFDSAEKGEEPTDTGVTVGLNYDTYMWTVKNGLVYFADGGDDNSLKTYNTETKETNEVFSSDVGIRSFDFMGDDIVFYSRYEDDGDKGCSRLSIYDTETKKESTVLEEDSETGEHPVGFIVSDDWDYIIVETENYDLDIWYYKVSTDGNKELILEVLQFPEEEEGEDSDISNDSTADSGE